MNSTREVPDRSDYPTSLPTGKQARRRHRRGGVLAPGGTSAGSPSLSLLDSMAFRRAGY